MRTMRRQMIYTVLIILAFLVYHFLHVSGHLTIPQNAVVGNGTVQIPLTVTDRKHELQTQWVLVQQPDKRWAVIAHSGRLVNQFVSGQVISQSQSGTTYATSGSAAISGQAVTAQTIYVNAAKTQGYILFRFDATPGTGNLTSGTNTAG